MVQEKSTISVPAKSLDWAKLRAGSEQQGDRTGGKQGVSFHASALFAAACVTKV